jgi:hypothetical protein
VDTSTGSPPRPRDLREFAREEPLTTLAIAGAVGFVLGGGVNSRLGVAMISMITRSALRAVASSMLVGMISGTADIPRSSSGGRKARPGDGSYDNGRADF